MTSAPPARLDGILARGANVAVVFRRGPSKRTQLLRWNLDTDEVTPGQWISGQVYTPRCDLSPDGELLVGAYTNYSRTARLAREARGEPAHESWTAVSRAPYFTALALWPGEGAWNLGGLWRGADDLGINLSPGQLSPGQAFDRDRLPASISAASLDLPRSEDEPIFGMRLALGGWSTLQEPEWRETNPEWRERRARLMAAMEDGAMTDPRRFAEIAELMENTIPVWESVRPGIMVKPFAGGRLLRTVADAETWSAEDAAGRERLAFRPARFVPQWLDVDGRGRAIYGDAGCLWAWTDFPDGEPTMIADLNANVFEPVAPPAWATEWPT